MENKKSNGENSRSRIKQKSHRGALDELESLRSIVAENPTLLNKVLEKIRIHKALSIGVSRNKVGSDDKIDKDNSKKDS